MISPRPWLLALSLLPACASAQPAPPTITETPAPTSSAPAEPSAAPSAAPTTPPAPAGTYTAKLATAQGQAVLLVTWPCPTPSCKQTAFKLGPGRTASRAALVDLEGPSFSFHHQGMEGSGLPDSLPAGAAFPAVMVLVGTESGGVTEQRLVIVSLRGDKAVEIFSEALGSHHPGGGGFSTINSIELRSAGVGPLEISFSQTSIPRPSDKPFRPGPPLHRSYRFDGTRYVRK